MAIYLNPEAFEDKAIPPIKNKEHIIKTIYSELKNLVDEGKLIPGMQYRITDYVTTTTQKNTQSANHPFDIIVIADTTNKLNCKARAIQHERDTYFNTSQLEKWELWYDIENNTDKYNWADTVNGKGVIYRMIDAYFNDCPYDFKNIQFLYNYNKIEEQYFYTFSWIDEANNIYDCSILGNDGTLLNDESEISGVYNNIIKPYYYYDYTTQIYTKQFLNNNKFISSYDYEDGIFYGYYFNTFGNSCHSNSFGNDCRHNTFGNNCFSNTFGNNCHSNSFGNDCRHNTFDDSCYSNTFGNSCYSNSFGNDCRHNTFGDSCSYNTFDDDCYYNTFGNNCRYNIFGNNCYSNTFDNCNHIKFASDSSALLKHNYYQHNHFGDGCSYILFKGTGTASNSQQIQNYNFAQGLEGTSNTYLIIDGARDRAYETKVAKNSNGELKIYCETDLIS